MIEYPNIIPYQNPTAFESDINALQQLVANSTNYFDGDKVLGISEKNENDNTPIIRYNNTDYFSSEPNDWQNGIVFFYENASRKQQEETIYQSDLSLVAWLNVQRFDETINAREHAIEDILRGLNNVGDEKYSDIEVFTRKEDVYTEYDLTNKVPQDLPFRAFRISFKSVYNNNPC